ncbi:DNA-binding MarR family transcriptional regulator [Pseudoclavibacter sp. JAI123]|uniref:MarR family winged helix-turn-helix transcriptional regulator n=1 Tax=Pseudoclavibacter sp. JAI123 TaxID=2723065 RepID=UPI0015C9F9FF|nr:MarR family transcriptional regulator [Pseudoclavibacter sp. JAI123]NYF12433.1 DNA-binding MarR family transcriptional regulator [Pseudoclavibacter sp. JAI123]
MAQKPAEHSSGYWYPTGGQHATSVDVLNLLREYREAEAKMRARTRSSMRMNENDLLALRFLLQQQRHGKVVVQKDLGQRLNISSASVTGLVDRLVKSGHVERRPHPTDRRASIIAPTVESDREVRETLGVMHKRMIAVVDSLSTEELDGVAKFLSGMVGSVQAPAAHDAPEVDGVADAAPVMVVHRS